MNWLQERLDELDYTHQDLQSKLAEQNIVRVRATITGWTNGKPISLFNDPRETKILATVLDMTVTEMLVAAGYDIGIPPELAPFFDEYRHATAKRKRMLLDSLDFMRQFVSSHEDEELDDPEDEDARV